MGKVTYFEQPAEEKVDEEALKALEEKKRKEKLRKEIRRSILPWIIFGVLFCVGIGFFVYSGMRNEFRHNNWVATEAVVANFQVNQKHEYVNNNLQVNNYYHTVFQYTFDGKEYFIADKTGGTSPEYRVGETVTIYVNPDDPQDFESTASSRFFYFFGAIVTMLSFFALCVSTMPVLEAAYPKAYWPKYVGLFLPVMVFMLTIVVISLLNIKPHSVLNIGMLIVFFVSLAFTVFLGFAMIKEMVDNYKREKRISKKIAEIDEILKDCAEFKRQNSQLFDNNPQNIDGD